MQKFKLTDTNLPKSQGIYAIVNTKNNKIYIGSTSDKNGFNQRFYSHRSGHKSTRTKNLPLYKAVNKYGQEAFEILILEIIPSNEVLDKNYITDVEQHWFDSFRPFADEDRGYNICKIAGSSQGTKRGNVTRAKLSAVKKGEKHPMFGKKQSKSTIDKKVIKLSKTYTFLCPKGVEIKVTNLAKFCRENKLDNASMCRLAQGKIKAHKGWKKP